MPWSRVVEVVGELPEDFLLSADGGRFVWWERWTCDEGQLVVYFDDTGTVTDVILISSSSPLAAPVS
jgi:hypothetical protein